MTTVVVLTLAAFSSAQQGSPKINVKMKDTFDECAKAIHQCQLMCDKCARHCEDLIVEGKTAHHVETMRACRDCASICSMAASVIGARGIYSDLAASTCATACSRCAHACEEHGGQDAMMKKCAEECRRCERICREMIGKEPTEVPGKKVP